MVNTLKTAKLHILFLIAATSMAAVSPFQTDAANRAESQVAKVEFKIVHMKREISVEYHADAVTQPWNEYNKAKVDYKSVKAAVSKLSGYQNQN